MSTQSNLVLGGGNITSYDVYLSLRLVECHTPLGIVAFDGDRINMASNSIFVQQYKESHVLASSADVEIVGPEKLATRAFIYPMPTWDDRHYIFSITGGSEQVTNVHI